MDETVPIVTKKETEAQRQLRAAESTAYAIAGLLRNARIEVSDQDGSEAELVKDALHLITKLRSNLLDILEDTKR